MSHDDATKPTSLGHPDPRDKRPIREKLASFFKTGRMQLVEVGVSTVITGVRPSSKPSEPTAEKP